MTEHRVSDDEQVLPGTTRDTQMRASSWDPLAEPSSREGSNAILNATAHARGATIWFNEARLDLLFPGSGRVSVGWRGALDDPSWAVDLQDGALAAGSIPERAPDVAVEGDCLVVRGRGITVVVGTDGSVEYRDGAGRVRRRDEPPEWRGAGWVLRSTLPRGASVHGLGGRGVWDLRGGSFRCWNTDPGGAWLPGDDPLYVTTPVYAVLTDEGAVHCFIDNPYDGVVEVSDQAVTATFEAGPARWHVSIGSLAEGIDAHTRITGRPAVPPRWAFGHHQARWGYGSSAVVREVWRGFRDNDLPLSALHLDIDHMEDHRDFTFGPDWPDIESLIAEMAADGVRTVVIVDAGIARARGYRQYDAGLEQGVFCRTAEGGVFEGVVWPGPTVFPDFTEPAVRRWWGDQLAFYAERGVAGFWHDMNEPTCFVPVGDPTFPLSTRHDLDGHPGDHRAAHNVYGLQMCRASYEGLLRLSSERRPFLFSRSGWAGMQRYGGHWSGDIHADWAALRGTIHQAFAYGLSGVGYYGSDIGGFTGVPSPELFTRWFQLASFLPFFRTHCAFDIPRREPWEWGPEVLTRLRVALRRRYRLLPLWYSLALSAGRDGAPLVRPLAWLDTRLRTIDDQFLVGDTVLVAPVLEPGATVRRVVLPAGAWFHGDTGERFEGTVELPVGPDDLPWFVREGAVVPTEEEGRLVLLVAPPGRAGHPAAPSRLLTDAGDGWEPSHEEHYTVTEDDGSLVVTRQVVTAGESPFEGIEVRAIDGSPVLLL